MSKIIGLNLITPNNRINKPVAFERKVPNHPQGSLSNDEFFSTKLIKEVKSPKETVLSKLKSKLGENIVTQKANEVLLEQLFSKPSLRFHSVDSTEIKIFIKELSKLDYSNIAEKYNYIVEEVSNSRRIVPTFLRNILTSENVTKKTLESLNKLVNASRSMFSGRGVTYRLEMMVYYLNSYSKFNSLTTKNQYDFMDKLEQYFDAEDISLLEDDDDLMRFDLIRDIKKLGSVEALKQRLVESAKNSPVTPIIANEELCRNFLKDDTFSFKNLKETIGNMQLEKYKKGIPLKYSRADFIEDFKTGLKNLDEEEKQQVYKYYRFEIDEDDDIIKYPTPNTSSVANYSEKAQNAIISLRKNVEDFMLNNEIRLSKKDKASQEVLNKFIKIFPEFISVIGKIQHRGDSIDFHTLDDLQMCLNDPRTAELSNQEQKILFLSVMFHDIAKKQEVIDRGHQKPSAYYAKEIIKKIPFSFSEKERIFNLILNSHWTTDCKSIQDIALDFRYNNDFKMAQILAKADGASAGFDFPITPRQLEDIQKCINKINSTGIPLFADNLPDDKSKFPTNEDGIKYLDFTDENADLSRYGFKKGTKVKDLNFLCHNTANSLNDFINLCDDSKDVCLSAEYKNSAKKGIVTTYNAGYSGNSHIILHCNNQNIASGGTGVSCTGGKKGRNEFKDYAFMNYFEEPYDEFQKKLFTTRRNEISNGLKEKMHLNDTEYAEFFNKINQFKTLNDVKDISLSTGKKFKADEIKDTLSAMQKRLTNNISSEHYINEFVIFRPKVEAIIMGKYGFNRTPLEQCEIKQIAKEHNIPVILV